ncbi:MAG: hypothetical protein AB1791_23110, partial [Chloroflexota bacterium]
MAVLFRTAGDGHGRPSGYPAGSTLPLVRATPFQERPAREWAAADEQEWTAAISEQEPGLRAISPATADASPPAITPEQTGSTRLDRKRSKQVAQPATANRQVWPPDESKSAVSRQNQESDQSSLGRPSPTGDQPFADTHSTSDRQDAIDRPLPAAVQPSVDTPPPSEVSRRPSVGDRRAVAVGDQQPAPPSQLPITNYQSSATGTPTAPPGLLSRLRSWVSGRAQRRAVTSSPPPAAGRQPPAREVTPEVIGLPPAAAPLQSEGTPIEAVATPTPVAPAESSWQDVTLPPASSTTASATPPIQRRLHAPQRATMNENPRSSALSASYFRRSEASSEVAFERPAAPGLIQEAASSAETISVSPAAPAVTPSFSQRDRTDPDADSARPATLVAAPSTPPIQRREAAVGATPLRPAATPLEKSEALPETTPDRPATPLPTSIPPVTRAAAPA